MQRTCLLLSKLLLGVILLGASKALGARHLLFPMPDLTAPVVDDLPAPESLTAMKLSLELVGNFTVKFGAGTMYALCRNKTDPTVTSACESGLQCCGYLGSPVSGKLPDTCVRNTAGTECPRAYPGNQGGPCATNRMCDEGLVCCDARPYLEGLTSVMIPTCQHNGSVVDAFGRVFC